MNSEAPFRDNFNSIRQQRQSTEWQAEQGRGVCIKQALGISTRAREANQD